MVRGTLFLALDSIFSDGFSMFWVRFNFEVLRFLNFRRIRSQWDLKEYVSNQLLLPSSYLPLNLKYNRLILD